MARLETACVTGSARSPRGHASRNADQARFMFGSISVSSAPPEGRSSERWGEGGMGALWKS